MSQKDEQNAVRCAERILFFLMSDLCHTGPASFSIELSTDADLFSTSFSDTNRFPHCTNNITNWQNLESSVNGSSIWNLS